MKNPIILTEYPKSGGSWVSSMIGDALGLPKRDIYMRPGFNLFNASEHPWYKNGAPFDFPALCVIKSHELPDSELVNFDANFLHLVRDGRDVIVSKWFFDKEFMVKNGITTTFTKNFDDYVEETATAWSDYIKAWQNMQITTVRYEDFLADAGTALGATIKAITGISMPASLLQNVVLANTKEKFAESLSKTFQHNTFVRRGIAGDWRNHFSQRNIDCFRSIAGNAMSLLGYRL
ncbi:sulfotransferase domain-containing protein [Paraburkholderia acidipaludis]|uniref:sulfotransferase domain-containing protein n=1 Tax=Paraburkholderia acidipaludis TaxID=660537 RepID=UPI000A03CBA8|nr:sulfotransferase domain-containing protein [Paraburkholderia acidipaludis]